MRLAAALIAAAALLLAQGVGAGSARAATAASTAPARSATPAAVASAASTVAANTDDVLATTPLTAASGTATTVAATTAAVDPNALQSPPTLDVPPPGHQRTANQVIAIANAVPKVQRERGKYPGSYPNAYMKGAIEWQVSYFSAKGRKEIAQVTIADGTGAVIEAWTGYQVPWTMARGYPGAFGRRVNAWYVWLPFCVLFVAPFLPRRLRHVSWLHVDLLALVSFSASLYFFNRARIGLSTPLIYPPLLYLLLRMVVVARRPAPAAPLRLLVPASWLAVALVFLIGFRVGLNVTNSNVIDVGYSGVIGAHRLVHGQSLYGGWPADDAHGDTYGPVNSYAYVPFQSIFGWSGHWDNLPAAHAATIAFDVLTILGLFLLGRRVRGPTLGIVLAYAWAAFPFTLYVVATNSNDGLVALLLVATLLVATSPAARGAFAALAGLTKLAPLALAPLLSRTPSGIGPRGLRPGGLEPGGLEPREQPVRRGRGAFLVYATAFAATLAVAMLPVILDGDWRTFWSHTFGFQQDRGSPFSIWGLWGLDGLRKAVQGAAILFSLALAIWPRRPTIVQTAALGAAVLIALQLGLDYWFYLYVAWFFPLVIVALFSRLGDGPPDVARSADAGGRRQQQLLDPVGA